MGHQRMAGNESRQLAEQIATLYADRLVSRGKRSFFPRQLTAFGLDSASQLGAMILISVAPISIRTLEIIMRPFSWLLQLAYFCGL
jgi:hypothetical protein